MSNSQLNNLKSLIRNNTEEALKFHQIWLEILIMKLIFHINYY